MSTTPVLPSDHEWLHGHAFQWAQSQGHLLDVCEAYADWSVAELDADDVWELLPTHPHAFPRFVEARPELDVWG